MQKCLHICIKKDEKKIIYAAKTMYMQSVTLCSSLRLQPKQIEIISKLSYRNQFYTSTFYFLDKHMVAIKFKRWNRLYQNRLQEIEWLRIKKSIMKKSIISIKCISLIDYTCSIIQNHR